MKFRWRGGTRGFFSRRVGRAISRSVPDDQLGSCLLIAFLLVLVTGSPIIAVMVLGMILSILPLLVLVVLLVAVGVAIYFSIKNRYPQMLVSWFFLKEDEADGTILPIGEIKNRMKESFGTLRIVDFIKSFNITSPRQEAYQAERQVAMHRPTSKRIFGMTYLQITVLVGLGVVGSCLVGYMAVLILFRNQPKALTPNISPTTRIPTSAPIVDRECQASTDAYINKVAPLLTEFGDTVKVANSTPRIALAPIIQELQKTRRSISDIPVPRCAAGAATLLLTSLDEIINAMISFLGDESDSKINRQFDQGVLDMRNANEQLVALAAGRPTPIPQKLPTTTPIPPTPLPLPVGSTITIIDTHGISWEISVTDVIIADQLKSQVDDSVEKAYGRFAVVFMSVTNRGFSPETFIPTSVLMIHDNQGNPYGENTMATLYAEQTYQTNLAAQVNPDETKHIVVVFDISKEGSGYSLTPGLMSNIYSPGVLLNIP